MKKLTFGIALLVAGLATAGMMKHRDNPLPFQGKALKLVADVPLPPCPPGCAR